LKRKSDCLILIIELVRKVFLKAYKVFVQKGRDWESKKNSFVFTGLNQTGVATWGKKK
jgi:hypothetical protein